MGLYVPAGGGRSGARRKRVGADPGFPGYQGLSLTGHCLRLAFLRAGPVGRPLDSSSCLFAAESETATRAAQPQIRDATRTVPLTGTHRHYPLHCSWTDWD